MNYGIEEIISGGQTGADRAALDFALYTGIGAGGWVPKGRMAEDGRIPDKYTNMTETHAADPAERTRLNVADSDATLIISANELSGGSELTRRVAEELNKPCLHADLSRTDAVRSAAKWLGKLNCRKLNIAGPRASEEPGIYSDALRFLSELFATQK